MLIEHEGIHPRIAGSAYVAPTAVVCGDIEVGEDCRILFGAVLVAEGGPVVLGRACIVMENALVRGRAGHPTRLGDHTLVGPHAHLNGAEISDRCFLATGVSVFPGARVGSRSEVRINGVVHVNTVLEPDSTVPIGWVAVGDPAQLLPPNRHEQIWEVQARLDFPGTVYGVERPPPGASAMEEITRGYAELFGRHREDRIVGQQGSRPSQSGRDQGAGTAP
ncbi:MAG: gamma carbonic anhydrase family protein [Actinomycetota bacterium]|nr:gamma carbonic anhydrase family protein [Actinomycetota bacterium]